MKAIILCAGYATRLYPLTIDKPKALLPINGKPILNYTLDKLTKIKSIDKIYVVTNSRFAKNFTEWRNALMHEIKESVVIVDDGTSTNEARLGGIGDLWFTIKKHGIDDDILVILGDNLFTFDLDKLEKYFKRVKETVLVAYELNNKEELSKMGVVNVKRGTIFSFEDRPKEPKSNLVSTGIYLFKRSDILMMEKYMSSGKPKEGPGYLILDWMKERPIKAYIFKGEWFDIGSKEVYEKLNSPIKPFKMSG